MTAGAPPAEAGDLAAWPASPGGGGQPMKWAEVDPAALERNAAAVTALVGPGCGVMAMVKANGYGHGAVLAARAMLAGGCRELGVSSPEEALQLRAAGIEAPILVVGWTHPSTHAALVEAGVDLTAFDAVSIRAIAAVAQRRPARVHLKLETGMHRLGAEATDVGALLDEVGAAALRLRLVGVFTHFADADSPDPGFTEEQHARFLTVLDRVRASHPDAAAHCANSAGLLRFPHMRQDLVRPGIVLYGYEPAHCAGVIAVEPAMSLVAWVTRVFTARSGDTVGYSRTWTASRDTRIAVVAAGYGDGVHRVQGNRGHALVRGILCPIVGAVSMDQVTVDVSAVDGVTPGDTAELLARTAALDAAAVAAAGGTSSYEVLCAVSARVTRRLTTRPPWLAATSGA